MDRMFIKCSIEWSKSCICHICRSDYGIDMMKRTLNHKDLPFLKLDWIIIESAIGRQC